MAEIELEFYLEEVRGGGIRPTLGVTIHMYDDGGDEPAITIAEVQICARGKCISTAVSHPYSKDDALIAEAFREAPDFQRQWDVIIEDHDDFADFRRREKMERDEMIRDYQAAVL